MGGVDENGVAVPETDPKNAENAVAVQGTDAENAVAVPGTDPKNPSNSFSVHGTSPHAKEA